MKVILTEKPSVARDIARVLGVRSKKEGYLEGNGYQVTWAFGHLVELMPPEAYDPQLKRWTLAGLPFIPETFRLQVSPAKGVKKQFGIIKKLFRNASEIICATDAGREGELIFRYIAQLCRVKSKPAKRLWISSLTDNAIRQGFDVLKPLTRFDTLAAAARCRSEADWIIGLNTTRAYTVKHSHGRGVLSVGRVQTPVLAMIVLRDQTIRNFQPEEYWELWTIYRDVRFKHKTDRFKTSADCRQVYDKVQHTPFTIVDIIEKKAAQMPPKLFDLTELQRVMNRKAGFSAKKTLAVAQDLYEAKLISYPRTDSRYLSDDVYKECRTILRQLRPLFSEAISRLDLECLAKHRNYFDSKKVTDHHAIIPTGQLPGNLSSDAKRVYTEISTRFIAIFYPSCRKVHTTVAGDAADEQFSAKGTRIVEPGWMVLYGKAEDKEDAGAQVLPVFTIGESGEHEPSVKPCQTKPPKHFNEASLLSAMETAGKVIDDDLLKEAMQAKGLGTPATRAGIIETLLTRDYIRKEKRTLLATPKGEDLIRLLAPQKTLTSPELTGEWECQLKRIEKGEMTAEMFMTQIRQYAVQIIETALSKAWDASLGYGLCPRCGSVVIKGKTGYGCSAWRGGCEFRFHAEQHGTIIRDEDVPALLTTGRLRRPRKLTLADGSEIRGYLTLDAYGGIGILRCEEKKRLDAIGCCPLCGGSVMDSKIGFCCDSCDFIIWKKIAGRKTSAALAKTLLTKGRSQTLKGFRSKAGKPFSAALRLKKGKVEFEFKPSGN